MQHRWEIARRIAGAQSDGQKWNGFGEFDQLSTSIHIQYWFSFWFQLVQLLVCDWLLESRTACWEMEQHTDPYYDDNNNYTLYTPVSSHVLQKFQTDLNSLNCIIDQIPVIKLRPHEDSEMATNFNIPSFQIAKSRLYLYEAICRLMAGAAPGHTQALLDRSAHEQVRRNRSTFHCGSSGNSSYAGTSNNGISGNTEASRRCGQNNGSCLDGERERATAMYVACKYLPTPLLCLPGERAGMLAEAAKSLKKIGDRKKLKDCYQLMKSFGNTTTVTAN